jgi:Fic family protein
MNSHYSNRIEGQSTHPVHIARRQRLALAHIHAEQLLEASVPDEAQALQSNSLLLAQQTLYEQLAFEDRCTEEGAPVVGGQLRQQDVAVSRHQPPTHASVPLFLARADERYAKAWGLESLLVVAACAHHRLAWVHPFLADCLVRMGFPLDTLGMLFPNLYPEAGVAALDD